MSETPTDPAASRPGDVVPDAMIETWQADPDGGFPSPDDPRGAASYPGFRGYARAHTITGEFAVFTLKPGRVPDGEGGLQAPHVDVSVFARGLLDRVVTRIYFADEAEANAEDVVLRFDLPGIDPDSIEVTVDRDVLSVTAHREEEIGDGERPFVRERRMGTFARRVRLPDHLDADGVEAAYDNGVLAVRIPVLDLADYLGRLELASARLAVNFATRRKLGVPSLR